ncbi:purine and uridine phosphorylase, partial [Colletotrichum zoysiae]
DYTVGWVCALPLEMAAAKGMLDKVHPNLPEQDVADHNSYVLGQVQGHNVVIACLPAGIYGTTPAATVAKDVLRTFKSIRFGLMVGIGGGAPSQKQTPDIRLGDIVVSQPSGTSGGVIQYDRGKTVKDGEFQRTGSLNAPPQVLLAALNRLQADHMIEDSKIPQFLRELVSKSPKRMKKKFVHQGAANDHLFNAGYDHVSPDATCKQCCDLSQTVKRDDRDDTDPVIHYGNIASGNQVVKDAKTRDRLSKELGALCFEMEAAGLQDFPCLVIRGICDYADSHKNKSWQEYAAATAAAFAKELLSVIPPTRVLQEKPIPHIRLMLFADPRLHELVSNTNTAISVQTQKQEVRYKDQKQVDCHLAFKTSTYEKFKNINPERVPGTCKWVLDHPRYTHWRESRHDDLLWISADPGCGKSVLAKFLIDEELQHTTEHTVCHFFFKDNTEQNSLSTALCALLHQLFQNQILLLRHAMPAFERNGQSIRTEVDELWRIFLAAAMDDQAVNITCVIDALDECCVEDRRKLIRYLTNFHKRRTTSTRNFQLKFLVTSRPYQDVESEFRDIPEPQSIRLAGEDSNASISEEINLVIQDKVATAGRKLGMSQDLQNALQEKLSSVPHRTYLWLHLVIDEVYHNPKRHKNTFIKELKSLPTTVEDAYEKILGRINHNRRQEAQTLLHIIVAA